MTQIGVRAFEDNVIHISDLNVDYFEVAVRPEYNTIGQIIPETNLKAYERIKDKIRGIHGAFWSHGINFMDETLVEKNRHAIELALNAADCFENCEYVNFHPGYLVNKKCGIENLYALMSEYDDKRLTLEIVPFLAYPERYEFPLYTVEDFCKLKNKTGKEILIDVGHAAITSRIKNYNPLEYCNQLIRELNINIMHVADNDASDDGCNDFHMHIGEGEVPIEEILAQNKNQIKYATLEVNGLNTEDINVVRNWLSGLNQP
ncbi:MAG: hypothetical protein KAT91_02720 [Candidatus Aenigmarchaeota archaeon]|nr:hypothetical protein [Candidatus Aenigmarchaeota archaeon]